MARSGERKRSGCKAGRDLILSGLEAADETIFRDLSRLLQAEGEIFEQFAERAARKAAPRRRGGLYQRFYGGAFRQLQDAGGSRKGDILEEATELLFSENGVPYVRTLPGTQATAGEPFGITVQPAPDFILHDGTTARGLLECKSAGDGGTARDKAGRFSNLRREAQRLGGIPVIAVLEGLGWRRVNDALGPVVRDCDGRVFTMSNLSDLLEVEPVAGLRGTA